MPMLLYSTPFPFVRLYILNVYYVFDICERSKSFHKKSDLWNDNAFSGINTNKYFKIVV